jgi:hypothetical protein
MQALFPERGKGGDAHAGLTAADFPTPRLSSEEYPNQGCPVLRRSGVERPGPDAVFSREKHSAVRPEFRGIPGMISS